MSICSANSYVLHALRERATSISAVDDVNILTLDRQHLFLMLSPLVC